MATLKKTIMGFQDQLTFNAGQKYCRMLQGEHSAILLTCIKLPNGFKTFVLSIFEWPLKTGFKLTRPLEASHAPIRLQTPLGRLWAQSKHPHDTCFGFRDASSFPACVIYHRRCISSWSSVCFFMNRKTS